MVIQIARHIVAVDGGLVGGGFRCGFGGFVVGTVETVAGHKAGGPALYISNRAGAVLLPGAVHPGPAGQAGLVGSFRFLIRIAVLGLGFDQALVHTDRFGGGPLGVVTIVNGIGVAALRTGVGGVAVVHAGGIHAGGGVVVFTSFNIKVHIICPGVDPITSV